LIGNAGADPEVRSLESGVKMARLRIATTERIYNPATGEKREHTEWHSVTLWRSQADFAERYIRKGTQIYVEGKIRSRELTDKVTGARSTVVEIHAEDIKTLGRRSDADHLSSQPCTENQKEPQTPKIERIPEPDDLPF